MLSFKERFRFGLGRTGKILLGISIALMLVTMGAVFGSGIGMLLGCFAFIGLIVMILFTIGFVFKMIPDFGSWFGKVIDFIKWFKDIDIQSFLPFAIAGLAVGVISLVLMLCDLPGNKSKTRITVSIVVIISLAILLCIIATGGNTGA